MIDEDKKQIDKVSAKSSVDCQVMLPYYEQDGITIYNADCRTAMRCSPPVYGPVAQQVNRDTFKFAIKNSACADENLKWMGIAKNPISDPGKKSKKGRLQLIKEGHQFKTQEYNYLHQDKDVLVPIFKNGKLLVEYNWDDTCERAASFV